MRSETGHGSGPGNRVAGRARFSKTPILSLLVLELLIPHHHKTRKRNGMIAATVTKVARPERPPSSLSSCHLRRGHCHLRRAHGSSAIFEAHQLPTGFQSGKRDRHGTVPARRGLGGWRPGRRRIRVIMTCRHDQKTALACPWHNPGSLPPGRRAWPTMQGLNE